MNVDLIHKLQHYFEDKPIEKAWIFGSYARGEASTDSDIDILVHFDNRALITLFGYIHIMNDLKKLTGKNIDLVEDGQLKNFAKDSCENEKILIYEREIAR